MELINSLVYGDDKKVMPSISSTDVIKLPKIDKIEIVKFKTFLDLIDENKGKSLVINDTWGSWIFQ